MLNLHRLRVLRAVGELGSLTRAARRLHFTQSAVSQQVATLEAELGVSLVVRRSRGVVLTHAGQVLFEHASDILTGVGRAERDLAALSGLEGGTLRIAAFPTAAAAIVPPAITSFAKRHPGVTIQFREGEPEEMLPRLTDGDVDLAVVFDYAAAPLAEDSSYRLEPLFEEKLNVALPKGHRYEGRRRLAMRDLAEETWINGNAYSCRAVLHELCRDHFAPRVSFESDDYATVQGFVAEGLGIALTPEMAAINLNPGVSLVPLSGRASRRRIFAAVPPGDYALPASLRMLDTLREVGARRGRVH